MTKLFKIAILPALAGGALAALHSEAIADCGCISIVSVLNPEDVPQDVCSDNDSDCVGFRAEGLIRDMGDDAISLVIHTSETELDLEGPQ